MARIEITLPMKPWLANFVRRVENLEESGVIDLKKSTFVAHIIRSFLTGKTNLEERAASKSIMENYTGHVKFAISYRDYHRSRMFLSPQSIVTINKLLYQFFHELLLSEILIGRMYNVQEKETIHRFLEKYDIEVEGDLTFDTVKKASYRLRNSKKIDNFRCPKSQTVETSIKMAV